MTWDVLAAASNYARRKREVHSVGVVVKKSSGGLWLVSTGGHRVLATPLTDEPIQVGSKVQLTAVGSRVQRPMILGAAK